MCSFFLSWQTERPPTVAHIRPSDCDGRKEWQGVAQGQKGRRTARTVVAVTVVKYNASKKFIDSNSEYT